MKRILRALGLKKLKQKYEFDVDLAEALDALAQEEKRAPEALAADLLAQAVENKQQTIENIELWERLSPREQEVVALVCCGYMNKEIGMKLGISTETVKTHVSNALRKFRVKRRGEIQRLLANWDFRDWV